MAVLMLIGACYGVWQLAMLGSWTRTVRVSALFLAVAVGLYGAGVLSVLLQLVYTHGVATVTGEPLADVVRTASYTVDPFIEEVVKVAPLALLVLLHKRIRQQWGLTDYVLVGAATGAGFTLAEALLRYSGEASKVDGNVFSGWSGGSGFSLVHYPGLPEILTSWVPAPVEFGGLFEGLAGLGVNPHLVLSALAGLAVGLIVRGGLAMWLTGAGLIAYVWADHATHNYRIAAPDSGGFIGLLSGPFELLGKAEWLYPLLALGVATYLDHKKLKAGRLTVPDVATGGVRAGTRLPWSALAAGRFVLMRRNLYFAKASGADTSELHELVREVKAQLDTPAVAQPVSVKPVTPSPRALWPILVSLILLVPGLLYFVAGTFPLTSGVQGVLASAVVTPVILLFSVAGLVWIAWQLGSTIRALPRQRALPLADPVARADLRIVNALGAITVGAMSVFLSVTGSGLAGPLLTSTHILDALGRATTLCGIALMFMALLLLMFPPGGGLALAGFGMLGGAGAMSPAALAALGAALGLGGLMMSAGSGKGSDYWEDKYGDEADKYDKQPRNERISDGNKQELQESGWLKERVPDVKTRREFMKWLEQGHNQGEAHTHLRPGSPEAEAVLQEFLSTL